MTVWEWVAAEWHWACLIVGVICGLFIKLAVETSLDL